jgi:tetratricopeptide (TPR) repeat protein
MGARRRSGSDLPHAPLELLHPLVLPGAEVPGREIVGELTSGHAATLLFLLRAVLAWSAHPDRRPAVDSAALERAERTLLARGPDALASPAGLLAGYMARPESASAREVAWACICVSDWASEQGARATAVLFAQAAALAWPRHARYAWLVSRMLLEIGRRVEAEAWLVRSWRIAVWTDDWEAQCRAMNSLGIVQYEKGTLRRAERLHLRAIHLARRHSLPEIEAIGHHNLFVICAERRERAAAERAAANAISLYGPRHPKVIELISDVANFWNRYGLYGRALKVFRALLARFQAPESRLRALAGAIRAAGSTGDCRFVDLHWPELWKIATEAPAEGLRGSALYEAALGARALGDEERARKGFEEALRIALQCGANEVAAEAELALAYPDASEPVPTRSAPALEVSSDSLEKLTHGFVESLTALVADSD